jgi:uncharacterized Fe-S cluster protein YjdI
VAVKEYRAGDVVVGYDPEVCIHASECVRMLPRVFDPATRPWIRPEYATPDEIAAVVARCPSGALSFRRATEKPMEAPAPVVTVMPLPNGPLILEGKIAILDPSGKVVREVPRVALCRCGHAAKKPYCDGSHARTGFQAP